MNYIQDDNCYLSQPNDDVTTDEDVINDSCTGKFGWEEFANVNFTIPYIIRTTKKYVSVRMSTDKILKYFLPYFHEDIYNFFAIPKYKITQAEADLLNEINIEHCDQSFGTDLFTIDDRVIELNCFKAAFKYLSVCFGVLILQLKENNKCGYLQIDGQSMVPFVYINNNIYLPLFYFDGDCKDLERSSFEIWNWDLAYLKFCCCNHKIKKDHYNKISCRVFGLDTLKKYLPPTSTYKITWLAENNLDLLTPLGKQRVVENIGQICNRNSTTNNYLVLDKNGTCTSGAVKPSDPVHSRIIRLENPDSLIPNEAKAYKVIRNNNEPLSHFDCINLFPYLNSSLLICLKQIKERIYPNIPQTTFYRGLQMLQVTFFKLNQAQSLVYFNTIPPQGGSDIGHLFLVLSEFLCVKQKLTSMLNNTQ